MIQFDEHIFQMGRSTTNQNMNLFRYVQFVGQMGDKWYLGMFMAKNITNIKS